jgi:hypothetical protein
MKNQIYDIWTKESFVMTLRHVQKLSVTLCFINFLFCYCGVVWLAIVCL